MYDFEPRFPLDHALTFYRAVSSGEYERGDLLMLTGAITGEIGALLKNNSISLSGDMYAMADTLDEQACCAELAKLDSATTAGAQFDPGVWIPIILKLIELWLSRRGS